MKNWSVINRKYARRQFTWSFHDFMNQMTTYESIELQRALKEKSTCTPAEARYWDGYFVATKLFYQKIEEYVEGRRRSHSNCPGEGRYHENGVVEVAE